ncbi:MAG: hypothetical protein L0Z53_00970 [Acidobacteriales bacterium]|nr:hypothetical protein [Terriglobales bacterium]
MRELLTRLWRKLFPGQGAAQERRQQQFVAKRETSGSKVESLRLGIPEGVDGLNDNLKRLIKDLGDAINDSLSDSEEIAEAIAKIKSEGYDVLLVLEATLGFSKREEEADEGADMVPAYGEPEFRVNDQDVKFLKSLRISVDEAA